MTGLLQEWRNGDDGALARLLPMVEGELRRIAGRCMRGERAGHSLQATALVNEAYLRLVDARRVQWQDRSHFLAMSARLMRRAGIVYVERMRQLDLRMSKLFRVGTTQTSVNFDFYNVLNSNSVINENITYGATWRTPQLILLPRIFKLSAQFDF